MESKEERDYEEEGWDRKMFHTHRNGSYYRFRSEAAVVPRHLHKIFLYKIESPPGEEAGPSQMKIYLKMCQARAKDQQEARISLLERDGGSCSSIARVCVEAPSSSSSCCLWFLAFI
jgi:hypothetical protein